MRRIDPDDPRARADRAAQAAYRAEYVRGAEAALRVVAESIAEWMLCSPRMSAAKEHDLATKRIASARARLAEGEDL